MADRRHSRRTQSIARRAFFVLRIACCIALCLVLTACNGGDDGRDPRPVSATPTDSAATPGPSATPTPDPNAYIAQRIGMTTGLGTPLRSTDTFDEDGSLLSSVTEEQQSDSTWLLRSQTDHYRSGADMPDAYDCADMIRIIGTAAWSEARVAVCNTYDNKALQSVKVTTVLADGSFLSDYRYYDGTAVTQHDIDWTRADGSLIRTISQWYNADGSLAGEQEYRYRETAPYGTPVYFRTVSENGDSETQECPDDHYIAATLTHGELAVVTKTNSATGASLTVNAGSFSAGLSESEMTEADGEYRTSYRMDKAYNGADTLVLVYSDAARSNLVKATIGESVWDRETVTTREVKTDSYGSFRRYDVHADGTEVLRFERKADSDGFVLSEVSYDDNGAVLSQTTGKRTDGGRTETIEKQITVDAERMTRVTETKYDESGRKVSAEEYVRKGAETTQRVLWTYAYDERGNLIREEQGNGTDGAIVTTYEYVYKSRSHS